MSRLGDSRNDGRPPKMPKDPKKAERDTFEFLAQ